MRFFSR